MIENWQLIPETGGWYEVSDCGRVRRAVSGMHTYVGRILKPRLVGYPPHYEEAVMGLPQGGCTRRKVHQLVAEAFIGPRPEGLEVNHIDGNSRNNHAPNLEYITHKDNVRHAFMLGLACGLVGIKNPRAKLCDDDVRAIRTSADSLSVIARRFGVGKTTVAHVKSGRTWRHVK